MKKRIFSIALALVMLLALAVPALAAEEPEYRLASVTETDGGSGAVFTYTFVYSQGGYLPTEVLRNGGSFVTATYDEAGRFIAYQGYDSSSTQSYDEDGNPVRRENSYNEYNVGPMTAVTEFDYDEDGNCIRKERTDSGSDGPVSTAVTEYTYDEDGNCLQEEYTRTKSDGAKSAEVTEYTYDEEGRVLSEVTTDNSGETDEMTYTYSEDGRCTRTDGNGNTRIEYEVPLLEATWQEWTYDNGDGTSYTSGNCTLTLVDNAGWEVVMLTCTCDGEPTLTYDDNGYLVRVDGAAGNSIELTYEPVA